MTYKIYLDNGGEPLYDEIPNPHNKLAVRCSCGAIVRPHELIDVRVFHHRLTNGEKFVCTGCYSTWEREKHKIDAADGFIIQEEFRAKFIETKTGRVDSGAERVRIEYLKKELDRVTNNAVAYASAPLDHPNKVRLESEKTELKKRIDKG